MSMLSSRDGAGVRSARKYAIHASSPLARDSTHMVHPLRTKRNSFSTSAHMHGLGGEAKEAMLRSGLRVKRTNSLLVEATKGSAVLTAAFHHNLPVPDLDIFRKAYGRKECEFAESIPSALCPFQFVPNDSEDSRWQLPKPLDSADPNQLVPILGDDSKMDDWFKDMRLKVHTKLVQKQIAASPIESDKTEQGVKKPLSPKATESKKKPEKPKMELALDAIAPSSSPRRSPHSQSARSFSRPRLSPKSSNRVAPASDLSSSSSSPFPHKKAKNEKYNSLPPIISRNASQLDARLPKIASHDSGVFAEGPLFQPRNESIRARRTYSELDVRRVRTKARNSVGLEPICDPVTAFDDMET